MDKPALTALRERVDKIAKNLDGTGISWEMGQDNVRRFDAETGKPYYYGYPARLTTGNVKLRALLDLADALPEIAALLRTLEAGER